MNILFFSFFCSSIPRDILENGDGKGTVGAASKLSRADGILAMRIRYNSYPIYQVEGDCMRQVTCNRSPPLFVFCLVHFIFFRAGYSTILYSFFCSAVILRFRYMRHWIETGHEKTFWKVPTLLKIAMDVLDDHLDDICCFHQALERGDIVFANNAMIAHARDQFKNDPDAPPRHKVRAWIQVQKADILNDEKMTYAYRRKSVSDAVSIIFENVCLQI